MAIQYLGNTYDDDADWLALIREAARFRFGPSWLRSDLDVSSGLAELAEQLKGREAWQKLANAAVQIIEQGTPAERVAVWQLPWEFADNAVPRLLRLVKRDRERLAEVRGVPNVIWRLLQAYPEDPDVLAALRSEAASETPDPWILEMSSKHKV